MKCMNCGGALSEASEICEFCGTVNDKELIERRKKGIAEKQIDESLSYGSREIDEKDLQKQQIRKRLETSV